MVPTVDVSKNQQWVADKDESTHAFRFRNEATGAYLEKRPDGNNLYAESKEHGPNQFIEARASKVANWALYLYKGNDAWPIAVKSKGPADWLELSEESHSYFNIISLDSKY